jgi:3-methyladenine DNA glycosylase AlkD
VDARPHLIAAQTAARLHEQLRVLGTPERALAERAYLKSDLIHLGVAVPAVRRVGSAHVRARPDLTHDELVALCAALWSEPVHERRLLAIQLLAKRASLLGPADLGWIEQLLRDCRTWALLDPLASEVAGAIVHADPGTTEVIDRWVTDDDFWIRRAALLALRRRLRDGFELDRFLHYADRLLPEREFFIRKAIGWVARECGQRRPQEMSRWVRANLHRMNAVTMREAVKYLPDGQVLLTEWRRGQSGTRRNEPGKSTTSPC